MTEHERHSEIRTLLKNLESVRASSDFEKKLHLKIIEEERRRRTGHAGKRSGIADFFQQIVSGRSYPWLAPAAGFVVLLFFVLYYVYSSRIEDTQQDPQKQESAVQRDAVNQDRDIAQSDPRTENENKKPNEQPVVTAPNENNPDPKIQPKKPRSEPVTSEPEVTSSPVVTGSVPDIQRLNTDGAEQRESSVNETKDEPVMEAAVEEPATEKLQARENDIQLMPEAGTLKSTKDTAKKNASRKLDSLSRKWLEEIEVKVRDTKPGN